MKLVHQLGSWAPWIIVRLYRSLLTLLLATCRFRLHGLEDFIATARNGKCALILWHNNLGLVAALLKKFAPDLQYLAVVSNSRDGRILGQLATSYPQCDALFVPHNARDVALKGMVTALQDGKKVLIVTPDGPRGPKHRLKPGIAMAAVHTGASIVTMSWVSSRSWKMPTWDEMTFPKPFSTIDVRFGDAVNFVESTPVADAVAKLEKSLEV